MTKEFIFDTEVWRPVIIDVDGKATYTSYEVSNQGRVRRWRPLSRRERRALKDGDSGDGLVRYVLKLRKSEHNNYYYVDIWHSGKPLKRLVHHLVAAAWLGPRPQGLVTDHINGDPTDNRAVNLQYITQSENTLRGRRLPGRYKKGVRGTQTIYDIHIETDWLHFAYRCTSWADFEARTGIGRVYALTSLRCKPCGQRVHFRAGFTVWRTLREAGGTQGDAAQDGKEVRP